MRNKTMNLKFSLFAVAATFAIAAPSFAQAPPAAGAEPVKLGVVCKNEFKTLCAGTKGADRARCLRTNQAKLSPDCAKAVAAKPPRWGAPAGASAAPAAPAPAAAAPATPAPPAMEKK